MRTCAHIHISRFCRLSLYRIYVLPFHNFIFFRFSKELARASPFSFNSDSIFLMAAPLLLLLLLLARYAKSRVRCKKRSRQIVIDSRGARNKAEGQKWNVLQFASLIAVHTAQVMNDRTFRVLAMRSSALGGL